MIARWTMLKNGPLSFPALAAGEGPVVILLHGFPDTPLTFGSQIEALAVAGYRAVAPTMRGYTPEAQPLDGDYHAIRMAEDVTAWAKSLGAGSPVHLVGHDWGANIAYAAASLKPELFASLTALSVPHPRRFAEAFAHSPDQQRRTSYVMDFQSPGFEDVATANYCLYLLQLWRDWSPHWDAPVSLLDAVKATFAKPNVAAAALSYYRQAFDVVSEAGTQTAALFSKPITVPTLGIAGGRDECIPASIFLGAMRKEDFPIELHTTVVAEAGHFLHAEQPDVVSRHLLDWFRAH